MNCWDTWGIIEEITEKKKYVEQLEYEKQLLQSLMDYSPDHLMFRDLKGQFLRINRAYAKHLGINSPDDAIGMNYSVFFSPKVVGTVSPGRPGNHYHRGKALSINSSMPPVTMPGTALLNFPFMIKKETVMGDHRDASKYHRTDPGGNGNIQTKYPDRKNRRHLSPDYLYIGLQ